MAIIDEAGVAIRADFSQLDGDVRSGGQRAGRTLGQEISEGFREGVRQGLPESVRAAEPGLAQQGDAAGRHTGREFSDGFTDSAKRDLEGRGSGIIGGSFKKLAGLAAGAFAAVQVGDFFKGAIDEARESQKVGALTEQVIKSTGGAAKVTAGQVGDLATAISNKTGIDDEAIQSASNLLLTFKNLRNETGKGNDVFNQATRIATDMGAALGTEPKAAAIQLGKALNDPTKGIAALSRVGVTFNAQQTDQIKKMQASGDILGAQKIILKELGTEFGGAAAASATAGEKFSTTFGNFKEAIGTALLPVLDQVLSVGTVVVGWLMNNLGPAVGRLGDFLAPVIDTVKLFIGTLTGQGADVDVPWMNTVIDIASAVGQVFTELQTVGASVVSALLPVLMTLGQTFTTTILPAVASLVGFLVANVIPVFMQVGQIIIGQVVPILAQLGQFIYGTLVPAIVAIVVAIGERLKPVFDAIFAAISTQVLPAVQALLAKFREWLPTIQAVISVVVQIIGKVLEFAAAILGKVLPPIIKFAAFLIGTLVKAVIAVIDVVITIIAKVIAFGSAVVDAVKDVARFASGVRDKFGDALDFIKGIPGKVTSALGDLGDLLLDAGREIIGGLLRGITQKFEDVKDFVGGIGSWIGDHKGPLSYDRQLLVPAGKAIMGGLNESLRSGMSDLRSTVNGINSALGISPSVTAQLSAGATAAAPRAGAVYVLLDGVTIVDADGALIGRMRTESREQTVQVLAGLGADRAVRA